MILCLALQQKHVTKIETRMNNNFSNLCDWFFDNKQSIHFGEGKTKSILFGRKSKLRNVGRLDITYQGIDVKQIFQITNLGDTMSGKSMPYKTSEKISSRLNYLFRRKHFFTPHLSQLLCKALSHFDYACSTRYPNLNKKLKTTQNLKLLGINVFAFVSILIK